MGDVEAARRDAWAAYAVDGADPEIQHVLLGLDPTAAEAAEVAGRMLEAPDATDVQLAAAAAVLLRGSAMVVRCRRDSHGLSGVVAWRGRDLPVVSLDGCDLALHHRALDRATGSCLARWRIAVPPHADRLIRAGFPGSADHLLLPCPALCSSGPAHGAAIRDVTSVIVPVYAGFAATKACLEALAAQTCRSRMQVVVVDDASPDPDLSRWVADRCGSEGWVHLRRDANAGFAGAINAGAALADGRDLLLLNADAVLPADGIDRLLQAVREDGVGTVVPFSNDGGFTSFPAMRRANAVPNAEAAARFDSAARAAAPRRAVDIPSGTAFCMLVTRPCWEAVGGLSPDYGRGYFEDVDLCLRARHLGYRNVLAPGLYVPHVGSQSFGSDKRALAARNAALVRDRFPDYDRTWASFVEADPLRPLRDAMERRLAPLHPVRLLVGRRSRLGPWMACRADAIAPRGAGVIVVDWRRDGRIALAAADGGVPQSLSFGPGEAQAFEAYLRALDVRGVEISEPGAVPRALLAPLLRTGAPLSIAVLGRAAARFLAEAAPAWAAGAEIVPGDRMAAAALRGRGAEAAEDGGDPDADAAAREPVRLAVLSPVATAAADPMLVGLDRRLRSRGSEVIVFGRGWSQDRSRPRATGPMPPADYPAAVRHRGITHLLLPDPDLPFALLDDLRRTVARPAAYVDWSGGRLAAARGDLALAEDRPADHTIARIATWCGAGRSVAPTTGFAP